MRKFVLLLAVGALWLFLAAIPAFADGGPHVAATNSGVSTLTPDSCAGCHRAHTAQGQYLINQPTEEDLCLGCHGTAVAGATADVMDGVQYAVLSDGTRNVNDTTWIGALRAGGFDKAHIGNVGRIDTGTSYRSKITVSATAFDVTSAHIEMSDNGLTNPHTLWGNGPVDATVKGNAGPSVSLECTDCHNPHGNNSYRILNTVPAPTGALAMSNAAVALHIEAIDANADTIYTKEGSPFFQGDLVTIAGVNASLNGDWVVWSNPNGITLRIVKAASGGISAATPFDITPAMVPASIANTMVINRTSAPVADSPLGTADSSGRYPTKNYTVYQTKVTDQTVSNAGGTYFAADIPAGSNLKGDYLHRYVPWNATSGTTQDAPNGLPATLTSTTTAWPNGQVAFNVQMTAWCSSCHTRYFAYQNPNPGDWDGTSTFNDRVLAGIDTATDTITVTAADTKGNVITSTGLNLGDKVSFANTPTAPDLSAGTWYVVWTGGLTTATTDDFSFQVSSTIGGAPVDITAYNGGGTVTRVAPATAPNYFFPDQNASGAMDSIFKYQHSTRADRVCTTCHVAHGSDRVMTGTYTLAFTQPDGSATTHYTVTNPATGTGTVTTADSRLLKADNRGICESCHDPTSTWASATATGTYQGAYSDTLGRGATGGTPGTNSAGQPIYTTATPVLP